MAESTFLVVATSGRAIAQGLHALGYSSVVIDGFADQDTIAAAHVCKKVARARFGLTQTEVVNAVQRLCVEYAFSGLLYDAAIEVSPQLLNKLNVENVIGNACETLQRCKDPQKFFPALEKHSISFPEVSYKLDNKETLSWLAKYNRSTGGIGVSSDANGVDCSYFQKFTHGISVSLTFLANGEEIQVLGVNTQWHEKLNDAVPFAYAGAINQTKLADDVIETATKYAQIIAKEFGLVGLNSIDYICNENDLFVLEVNPRIPATYELYETKYGDLMRDHMTACIERKLPKEDRATLLRAHAIIYAPDDIQIPADFNWPLWTADRPHSGEEISQFEPICSVFSGGKNYSQVCEMIAARKKTILNQLTT